MKKIYILIGGSEIGGAESQLISTLPLLQKKGFIFSVIIINGPGPLYSALKERGVEVRTLLKKPCDSHFLFVKFFYLLKKLFFFYKLIGGETIFLHCILPESFVLGGLAFNFLRFKGKLIMSRRSLSFYQKEYPLLAKIEKMLQKYVSVALGNSQAIVEELKAEKYSRIKLIYNGVDVQKFRCHDQRSVVRFQLNISDSDIVLVCVANLYAYKGHVRLLKIFQSLNPKKQNLKLLCIGRPCAYADFLYHLTHQLNIADEVIWTHVYEEIPSYLCSSDISILLSHQEGFSNAILESMASGLPVIATDVGGNKEAIVHNDTGFLIPGENEDIIMAKAQEYLQMLIDDQDKRKKMGKSGHQRVLDHFSLPVCIEAYASFYQSLLHS